MGRLTSTSPRRTIELTCTSAFEQGHRPARDYTTFGPFLFDREQYDSALVTLCAEIATAKE